MREDEELKPLFDEYEVVCILPVGIAENEPAAPKKKGFEERAWFNSFGGVS